MNDENRLSDSGEELPPQGIRPETEQFAQSLYDVKEIHSEWAKYMRPDCYTNTILTDGTVSTRCVYKAHAADFDHHIIDALGNFTEMCAEAFDEGYVCHPVRRTVIRVSFTVTTYNELDDYYERQKELQQMEERKGVEYEDC